MLENDLFTSSVNDKYYTNGIELFYRYLAKTPDTTSKKTYEWRAGQYIYNPQTVNAADPGVHDRPFAGYLFARFTESNFYRSETVFKWGGELGVMGAPSLAREMQETIHDVFGYRPVQGWDYQIKDVFAAQLHAMLSAKLFRTAHLDLHFQASAAAGSAFTGFKAGTCSRMSLKPLLPVFSSVLHGAGIGNRGHANDELFFYVAPSVNYQLYDASIQGSLFNHNSPITWDLVPWRFQGEAGLRWRGNDWDLAYVFVYRGKEVDNFVNKGFFYGSIQLSKMFR